MMYGARAPLSGGETSDDPEIDDSTRTAAPSDIATGVLCLAQPPESQRVNEHPLRDIPRVHPEGDAMEAMNRVIGRDARRAVPGGPSLGVRMSDEFEDEPVRIFEGDHVL
jgi:hypothetical protein